MTGSSVIELETDKDLDFFGLRTDCHAVCGKKVLILIIFPKLNYMDTGQLELGSELCK